MASSAITFRVDDSERRELVTRAERDKVSLSDYHARRRAGTS